MTMLESQITSLTVVYSIVYSGVNQRKHQSSASLAFVREIHRGPVNFPHKWPVTRKMFPFDDVIMRTCNTITAQRKRVHINGLVQERRNSIAKALELRLSCTNPSIYLSMFLSAYVERDQVSHLPALVSGQCGDVADTWHQAVAQDDTSTWKQELVRQQDIGAQNVFNAWWKETIHGICPTEREQQK